MTKNTPDLKNKILFPLFLITFMLLLFFSIYIAKVFKGNLEEISHRQYQTTLNIFSRSIRDELLRGLDAEVSSYCRLLMSNKNISKIKVYRNDNTEICNINKPEDKWLITLTSKILFSKTSDPAGFVEIGFNTSYFSKIINHYILLVLIFMSICILIFIIFGSLVIKYHLQPFSDLAQKLFQGKIEELYSGISIDGSKRNFEINSLVNGVGSLVQAFKDYQKEVVKNEKLKTMNEYSRLIAHDIKSPLSGIKTGLQMFSEKPRASQALMEKSLKKIEKMIQEILKKNSITHEKNQLKVLVFNDWIVSFKENNHELLSHKDILLTFNITENDNLAYCLIDPGLLERALLNIIKNSFEALSSTSCPKIDINIIIDTTQIKIQISDNGPGIPKSITKKIGQEGVTHGKSSGTGLGLYQVFQTIKKIDGSIQIFGNNNCGTKVEIKIPTTTKAY